jgi:hypothetical protein
VLYRHDGARVLIVHVMRTERLLRPRVLKQLKPAE